jgi:glycogen debranching enzyme
MLEKAAMRLAERFEEKFWCPQIGTYALALDGNKEPCAVRTSNAGHAEFEFDLPLHTTETLYLEVRPDEDTTPPTSDTYRRAAAEARVHLRSKRRRGAQGTTSGPLFNRWITRSSADLALLETDFPTGPYPFAGIPWFSAPFGRDAMITAL